MNTSNHTAESVVGCSEISSAYRINHKPFTLASRLFGQGQKAATVHTKISQEGSLGTILNFFFSETP